jgi:hypothetical protein
MNVEKHQLLPLGARVCLDGDPSHQAIVQGISAAGTSFHAFPHYLLFVLGETRHVAVAMGRVSMLAKRK